MFLFAADVHHFADDAACLRLVGFHPFYGRLADVGKQHLSTPFECPPGVQAANHEEGVQTQAESDANDDDALVRFEFLEVLVRIAFLKYIAGREMTDASDAVARLLEEIVLPRAPPAALLDPNAFRFGRMYCDEVEAVLSQHWDFLMAVFKV